VWVLLENSWKFRGKIKSVDAEIVLRGGATEKRYKDAWLLLNRTRAPLKRG
jgi:hypothetical protein